MNEAIPGPFLDGAIGEVLVISPLPEPSLSIEKKALTKDVVANRAAEALHACHQASAQIRSCLVTVESMASEIKLTGEQLALDFEKRAQALGVIVERFAGIHERHVGVVDQLRTELDELDKG